MQNKDVNILQLETIAAALGDLLSQVTFVGGSTTTLLVDEAARFGVRETNDVDVVISVATCNDYQRFSKALKNCGFSEDVDSPICRWIFNDGSNRFQLDVMPNDEKILGFSNRWYTETIANALDYFLPSGKKIKLISPAYFLATKFEAFKGRG